MASENVVNFMDDVTCQAIAELADGTCYLEYDARLTDAENNALARALIKLGRELTRAGKSDLVTLRCRRVSDIVINPVTMPITVKAAA